jgi:hypothetical protein
MARNFTHRIATRDKTPLLVGLVGTSSSGKTYSALRLATGFQRVNPGPIFVIDTEAGRALQYADTFQFHHVPFGAPFGSLDYLEVIKYCIDNGATNIVVDSMSHEHEGPGGMLQVHAEEWKRLGGTQATQGFAWTKPKQDHRLLINTILQFSCNFVFCFRARQKLDWKKKDANGKRMEPQPLGFMPIGDETWMYEFTMQALLLPGANGIPTWQSDMPGEKEHVIKLPKFFKDTFAGSPQLTEDVGEAMAKWAAGSSTIPKKTAAQLIAEYAACSEPSEFRRLEESRKVSWPSLSKEDKTTVKAASEQCAKKIEDAAKAPPPEPVKADDGDDFVETKAAG